MRTCGEEEFSRGAVKAVGHMSEVAERVRGSSIGPRGS